MSRAQLERRVIPAVAASVRHEDTDYDELLMSGVQRQDACARVRSRIDQVLDGRRS